MQYDAEEQYQTMMRAYAKLMQIGTDIGNSVVIGSPDAKDAARLFFNECQCFKNWLKKDSRVKRPQDVEDYIRNSKALCLAIDTRNTLEHAGPKRNALSGEELRKLNMAYTLHVADKASIRLARQPENGDTIRLSTPSALYKNRGRTVASATLVLTIGEKQYRAIDIAAACIQEWDRFLRMQGIHFAKS